MLCGGVLKGPNPNPPGPIGDILSKVKIELKEVIDFWKTRIEHIIYLSTAAEKLWDTWYKVYWRRKKGDDLIPAMNNGDRVTCRKLALINAALDRSDEIKPQHLEAAMEFTGFLYDCRYPIFSEHGANPNAVAFSGDCRAARSSERDRRKKATGSTAEN